MLLIGRQTDYGDAQAGLEVADDHTKSSEFAGVGSAVKVGLYYWGLACI